MQANLLAALGVDDVNDITADFLQNLTTANSSKSAVADDATIQVWYLQTAFNILFMQTGFALLEAGVSRANSVKTVLLKNMLDFGVTILAWWLFGFAIATLDPDVVAFSHRSNDPTQFADWLTTLSFCSTSVTIVSGGTLGRMEVYGYVIFSIFMTVVIYPVLSYWVWDPDGFLNTLGFLDFAGAGVVHATGGTCALIGAAVIGPRTNRFRVTPDGQVTVRNFGKHSSSLSVTGVWILVFGWTSFNAARLDGNSVENFHVSARAAVNTVLAIGAGTCTGIVICLARQEYNLMTVMNSICLLYTSPSPRDRG